MHVCYEDNSIDHQKHETNNLIVTLVNIRRKTAWKSPIDVSSIVDDMDGCISTHLKWNIKGDTKHEIIGF